MKEESSRLQAEECQANGLGGDSARAGFAYGEGDDRVAFELEGSAINGALLDDGENALVGSSNTDVDGRYLFTARGSEIEIEIETTPEPASILGLLTIGTVGLLKRKKSS